MASVVVVGGANVDVKARSAAVLVPGTSNPGTAVLSPGGVGRNVAENLARLGTSVQLVAALGEDLVGDLVLEATAAAGVGVGLVRRTAGTTGVYAAVLDHDGELIAAVSDMAATDGLAPSDLFAALELVAAADLVVLDGNLAGPTLRRALDVAAIAGVRVVLDPVSVPKAAALAPYLAGRPLLALTPNDDELAALVGRRLDTEADVTRAAGTLHDQGAEIVWVRRGRRGSLLSGPDGAVELPAVAVDPADVVDVTGAGDAMLAAFCHALVTGATPYDAARLGLAAAALTVASPHTVRPDLTLDLLRSLTP